MTHVGESIYVNDLTMDLECFRVSRAGRSIHLAPVEYRLLRYLMENPGQVLSRRRLLRDVWGDRVRKNSRTVDVHMHRLRRALCRSCDDNPIRTVRATGYVLGNSTNNFAAVPQFERSHKTVTSEKQLCLETAICSCPNGPEKADDGPEAITASV